MKCLGSCARWRVVEIGFHRVSLQRGERIAASVR
jgi:hypothetical protein